ncbi:GH11137 [Drosophila grimshawi]|uniref:GH11137 n=1 Tax=Drosophila grimshawi TaxID=7222 RepID=B4JD78_DROGR|nr:GH11137 [Drosophila grimshawi]
MDKSNGNRKHILDQAQPQEGSLALGLAESCGNKRKLYAIDESEESSPVTVGRAEPVPETAYDADVEELVEQPVACPLSLTKLASEREVIYELFQPWALKTYGDQAKTKTITLRKKARILKALEGKEHSRPDSSKFRFWVKTKGFTTKRPDGFEEAPGSRRRLQPLPNTAVLSDNPGAVDLFAASKSKDFGRRIYRKVACVEEFFDIIYNVHMELGGRSGMHAGQKRTYRIITETYAFLPREAVTRFLTICPECKKNLRPSSPSAVSKDELAGNESSSEVETYLNYSSHTESSLEAGPTAKRRRHSSADLKAHAPLAAGSVASCTSATQLDATAAAGALAPHPPHAPSTPPIVPTTVEASDEASGVSVPKIRVNTQLQRPLSPPTEPQAPMPTNPLQLPNFDLQLLKSRDNLVRYYDFMRRFYAGGSLLSQPVLAPPLYGSSLLQSLSFPTTTTTSTSTSTTASVSASATATGTATNNNNKPLSVSVASSAPSSSQKLKSSPDSSTRARSPIALTATPTAPQTPINLTKPPFSRSSNGQPASTSTPVSAPPLKLELPSPPKTLPADLRIPQLLLRGSAPMEQLPVPLPPLDLERLKPITSTYLQLTRSMGLSDEDALRFDNLLSY